MQHKTTRIALFIDGAFFLKVNTYYRFNHERRSNINFTGLVEFIRDEVAKQEGADKRYCHIVEAHWFRGRYSTTQFEKRWPDEIKRLEQLSNERRVEDIFMYQGIVAHNYPVAVDPLTGETEEKGIDVWLSLEAYELTVLKRYDAIALIAGDADYVPLIRKLNGLGTRVMVLGWDFAYEQTNPKTGKTYRHSTRTSQALIDECSYPILMDKRIDDRVSKNDPIVNAIFNN